MRFTPRDPQEYKPAVFIVKATADSVTVQEFDEAPVTFHGEDEIIRGLLSYGEYAVYSLIPLVDLCRCLPHLWALYRFNKQPTRAELGTLKVYGLSGYGLDPRQLKPFFDALTEAGIPYGSRSAMLKNSFRRTLREPLVLVEHHTKVGRLALRMGRRETIPGVFNAVVMMDIPAAYPSAMREPMPTRLRRAESGWYETGIARATIKVWESKSWAPYSMSELTGKGRAELGFYGSTLLQGYWTFDELRLFEKCGSEVTIEEAWEGIEVKDVFGPWVHWVMGLRDLPGESGRFAKSWSNRLWGMFAISPNSNYTRTTFDRYGNPTTERLPIGAPDSAAYISTIITSRIRTRLFLEGLQHGAIACDTDGVIVPFPEAAFLELRYGWRRKTEMAQIQIISQKLYRYKCMQGARQHLSIDGCVSCYGSRWHYVARGEQDGSAGAEWLFLRELRRLEAVGDDRAAVVERPLLVEG